VASGVRAKKSLGQHFLTDLNIARRIAEAVSEGGGAVSGGDGAATLPLGAGAGTREVLEIGGGMGVRTQFLLQRDDITLWGIEIDRESIAYMRERFPDFAPRLIEGDFLRFNLREQFPRGVRVAGNFPYNISSQIFFRVLENRDLVPEVVGMVQREVAQRIAEPPGSRTYGIMSVLLQAWYDIEYLFTVSESVFSPPPKVKSAVIRLTRNGVRELGCDEELFVRVVKAAFGQRRKMLRNALRAAFGDFGGAEHPLFAERAEKLSVSQFVELTNWVAERSAASADLLR
jgi:16S rRNA (adenine1518-N6/adenine1519-N6)-dimethyltransferase